MPKRKKSGRWDMVLIAFHEAGVAHSDIPPRLNGLISKSGIYRALKRLGLNSAAVGSPTGFPPGHWTDELDAPKKTIADEDPGAAPGPANMDIQELKHAIKTLGSLDVENAVLEKAGAVVEFQGKRVKSESSLLLKRLDDGQLSDIASASRHCHDLLTGHAEELRRLESFPDEVAQRTGLDLAAAKAVCAKLLPGLRQFTLEQAEAIETKTRETQDSLRRAREQRKGATTGARAAGLR